MIETKKQPTIELSQIELSVSPNQTQDANEYFKDNFTPKVNNIGKEPLLWYNGIEIPSNLISNFYLESNGFIPYLNVYFTDQTNAMKSQGFANDNTIISLYIDSRTKDSGNSPALRPIRMDFKIIDYGYTEEDNLFYLRGVPNIDDLYTQKIKSYSGKTSYEVLDELSEELKLGYSSNVSSSDDKMNWMNTSLENHLFIKDVANNAYINDESFITTFIDYYYNLNYINVEQQIREDINNQKGLLTMSHIGVEESKAQIIDDLYLVSKKKVDTSYNNIYDTYEVLNQSTKLSILNGYRTELYYYDKTGNWSQKAGTKLKFNIETNTEGNGIILKSNIDDNSDNGFFRKNIKRVYLPSLDIDNTHKNYNYSSIINKYNLDEINKLMIRVDMTTPNFNFYKFQKIKVVILEDNLGNENSELISNQRLSGGWLILAINYIYDPSIGLKQELIMVKRELNVDGDFNL